MKRNEAIGWGRRNMGKSKTSAYHFEEITNNCAADYFSFRKIILEQIVQYLRQQTSRPSRHLDLEYMRKSKSPRLPYPTYFAPLFPTDWLSLSKFS